MGTNKRLRALAVVSVVIVTIAAAPTFASLIETGSPGSMAQISRIAQTCPTFSWSLIQDATGYELVVYRLPDSDESRPGTAEGIDPEGDAAPALRSSVPAGVSAWSPSLDQCLNAEASYAWLVRPVFAESEGEWSEARMFAVDQAAAQGDLRKTLEDMVEQILEKRDKQLGRPVRQRPVTAVPTVHGPRVAGAPQSIEAGTPLDGRSALLGELPPPVPSEITFGLRGIVENTFAGSAGVLGESIAATGVTHGVRGITQSGSGTSSGVLGESIEGVTYGVQGVTTSDSADARGVLGKTFAENGVAVEGISSNPAGIGVGVRGAAAGDGARGLEGVASAGGSGVSYGVRGTTFSSNGRGVFGLASSTNGGRGVSGASVAVGGYGGYFENTGDDGTGLFASGGGTEGADLELGGTGWVQVPASNMKVRGGALEANLECDECIGTTDIATDAITTAKIAPLNVTESDIAVDAVTNTKIATDAVDSDEIKMDAVDSDEIKMDAVTADEIATDAVGSDEIATDAVDSDEIKMDAVTADEIAADAVGTAEIATDAVTADEIAANAVGTAEIADNAVTTAKIGAGEVTNPDVGLNAVALGSQTMGDYVAGAESLKGLVTFGGVSGEATTLGLQTCAVNQVLEFNGTDWACATGASSFASITTGENTSATMTVRTTASLVAENGGKIVVGFDGSIDSKANVSLHLNHEDTASTMASDVAVLTHTASVPVTVGMGSSLLLRAENMLGLPAEVGRFSAVLDDITNGAEKSTLKFYAADGTPPLAEVMSVDDTGKVTAASFSGDGSALTGVTAGGVAPDSVVLTTDTVGSYAAGTGEAGAALSGDTATGFFTLGQIEAARGGTGQDSSGATGVPQVAAGVWTFDAGLSDLAASVSSDLAGVLTDETGSGLAVFGTSPSLRGTVSLAASTGEGDSPDLELTPETGTSWRMFVDDAADDLRIKVVTPATETVVIENMGTGAADLSVEGTVTAASFGGDGSGLTGVVASVDFTTHTADPSAHHIQTVDTDTTCLDGGVNCLFAASTSEGGPATSATALVANGSNCSMPGSVAVGVDAAGNAECIFTTYTLTVRLPDVSTAGSAWVTAPLAGKVVKIQSVVDGAISASDATLTPKIGGTSITGGSITITEAGSAAGDVDESTPTAANALTAGSAIEIVTDGASTGSTAAVITLLVSTAP